MAIKRKCASADERLRQWLSKHNLELTYYIPDVAGSGMWCEIADIDGVLLSFSKDYDEVVVDLAMAMVSS